MAKHLPLHKFLMYRPPDSCPPFGLLGQEGKRRGNHDTSCNISAAGIGETSDISIGMGRDADATTSRGSVGGWDCEAQAFPQQLPGTRRTRDLAAGKTEKSKGEFYNWRPRPLTLSQILAFLSPGYSGDEEQAWTTEAMLELGEQKRFQMLLVK